MINSKRHIFAYPFLPSRAVSVNGYNPLMMLKSFRHCFGGFVIICIFVLTAVLYQHTALNFGTAQIIKSVFSKYERGKSLIQREHPSNVQLPTTRQGLHSIPNNPVRTKGVVLDCTKGSLLFYYNYFNFSLMGMKIREGLSKCYQ